MARRRRRANEKPARRYCQTGGRQASIARAAAAATAAAASATAVAAAAALSAVAALAVSPSHERRASFSVVVRRKSFVLSASFACAC